MKRILFVDDEPNVLQGLQRMLRPMRNEWDMLFVQSGDEALAAISAGRFDVIVSDMRMPGLSGADLLNRVTEVEPEAVRIILSGQSDRDHALRAVGATHQFLSKPCDPNVLRSTVARACTLRDLLPSDPFQRVVSQVRSLPSPAEHYQALLDAVQSDVRTAAAPIVAEDPAMAAKLLQLVNSAFFGTPRRMCSAQEAVALVGKETLSDLLSGGHSFESAGPPQSGGFSTEMLRQHSIRVGTFARRIVEAEGGSPEQAEEAYTGGLLHDVGMLIFAQCYPDSYAQTLYRSNGAGRLPYYVEHQTFGATHAEVGAYLLGLWGLPDAIVETVAYHHCPRETSGASPLLLAAVHVADHLAHQAAGSGATGTPDMGYLQEQGFCERLAVWEEACM